jgi:rhodanese-related sulfurtransferase
MSDRSITLEKTLLLRDQGTLLVDARSPAEFADGTIPGAVNVPLLDNDQRHQIGTVYKQQGRAEARLLGVKLVAPNIPGMIDAVLAARRNPKQPVVVFCWRGGMRSGAVVLRRRGGPWAVLAAPVALVALTTLISYGFTRFRVAAEPGLVVLAAVGIAALAERVRQRRTGGASSRMRSRAVAASDGS